jgi:hypothetical protein
MNRRAFFSGLAALAAPRFARLALAAGPERKLLGKSDACFIPGHLYVRPLSVDNPKRWTDLGTVRHVTIAVRVDWLQTPDSARCWRAIEGAIEWVEA